MLRPPLWQISVAVTVEAEEAVSELLVRVFGAPPVAYLDMRTARLTLSSYLDQPGAWSDEARAKLAAGLAQLRACGIEPGPGRIIATKLRHEDWAESWKRHFHAMEFGRALLVKPTWIRRRPRPGQQVVVLDPGLSFGTGQHPTTRFCLEQIAACQRCDSPQSFLDIGTGSGLLAIAAAKLGYCPVEAYDFDPDSIRVARANARLNGVSRLLHISRRDLTEEPLRNVQKFDVVCANLIHDLLVAEHRRIISTLHPAGTLVLAGILRTQFPAVARVYRAAGLRLTASFRENEWKSGAFSRA